jgi:hypothetical protein
VFRVPASASGCRRDPARPDVGDRWRRGRSLSPHFVLCCSRVRPTSEDRDSKAVHEVVGADAKATQDTLHALCHGRRGRAECPLGPEMA